MQLFELKEIVLSGHNKKSDGSYEIFEDCLGVFDSVPHAEAFMRTVIKEESSSNHYFGFFIFEKTLNDGLFEPWKGVCHYHAVWAYLPDGTLYCSSPYDDLGQKPFRGRSQESIPLKPGDLAWMWNYDRIVPCMVGLLPITDEEYSRHVKRLGRQPEYDYSDDCYLVYQYGKAHWHPLVWQTFPYFGTISKRNLQRLQSTRDWYLAGCP